MPHSGYLREGGDVKVVPLPIFVGIEIVEGTAVLSLAVPARVSTLT